MTKSNIEFTKICIHCGLEFIALKSSTKYCSHKCNSRAYKLNQRLELKKKIDYKNEKIRNQSYYELNSKIYLNIKETSKLLGVDENTIYRYIYSGKLNATKLSSRLTIIKKTDINALFGEKYKYIKLERPNYNCAIDFYTLVEIEEKYKIKVRRIWQIISVNNIPTIKIGKFSHVSKKHIDNFFKK